MRANPSTEQTAMRRTARILLAGALMALTGAMLISRWYWGYYLAPASVDERILSARRYLAFTPIVAAPSTEQPTRVEVDPKRNALWYLSQYREDPYYFPMGRVLEDISRRTSIDALPPRSEKELEDLLSWVKATGRLVPPHPGYAPMKSLYGLVLDAEGPEGERLVFVAFHSGEVSNDHYPHYEFLFAAPRIGGIEAVLRVRAGAEVARRSADRGRPGSEPGRWTGRAAP
jgi:hypothetical protein